MTKDNRGSETGHIGLNVSQLPRSLQFYQEIFGFEVISESKEAGRRFAFLGRGGRILLTLWEQGNGRYEKQRPGLHHLAFSIPEIKDLEEVERKLRVLNVPLLYDGIVAHRTGDESVGVFFEDPDGIRLEITVPNGPQNYPAPTDNAPACGFF